VNKICKKCTHLQKTLNPHRRHWRWECTLERHIFGDISPIDVYETLTICPNRNKFELISKLKDI